MYFINPEQLSIISEIAGILTDRKETVSVAESTSGGIVSSCQLSYPNASSYFVGGAVLYSYPIRTSLLRFDKAEHEAMGGCPTEIIKRSYRAIIFISFYSSIVGHFGTNWQSC